MVQTDSRKIVKATAPGQGDLALIDGDVGKTVAQYTARLKLMIVNGSRLTDQEAQALAIYSVANRLNPFNQECYYLPGTGPVPGITAYRRRGSEQLFWEAEQSRHFGNRTPPEAIYYWFTHEEITEGDAFFHPDKGDLRYRAVLHDSLTHDSWERRILGKVIELTKGGTIKGEEAMAIALNITGPEPVWYSEATVYGDETFVKTDNQGRPYPGKHDKWDRRERCMKRAEKWALKKRFNLSIPEPTGWDSNEDVIETSFVENNAPQLQRSATQNIAELGYTPMPEDPPEGLLQDPPGQSLSEQYPNEEPGTKEPEEQKGTVVTVAEQRPYAPEVLKARLAARTKKYQGQMVSDKLRKVVASCLDQIFNGDPNQRHKMLEWLTGCESTKEIPAEMILTIANDWLEVTDFNIPPTPEAMEEARAIVNQKLICNVQQEMTL